MNSQEKCVDTKGVIRSHKERQYNNHKKKNKRTNNELQNISHKAKHRATRTPLNNGSDCRCPGRISSHYSTLVVIDPHRIDRCKSYYHTITDTTDHQYIVFIHIHLCHRPTVVPIPFHHRYRDVGRHLIIVKILIKT